MEVPPPLEDGLEDSLEFFIRQSDRYRRDGTCGEEASLFSSILTICQTDDVRPAEEDGCRLEDLGRIRINGRCSGNNHIAVLRLRSCHESSERRCRG
jgi:hypothetical protein